MIKVYLSYMSVEVADPSYINTTSVKGSRVKSMPDLDLIDSKLELCMRIIRRTLECPSCSENVKLEIENYNHGRLGGGPSLGSDGKGFVG